MKKLLKKLLREEINRYLVNEKSVNDVSLDEFNIDEIKNNWLMSMPSTVINQFKYDLQDDYYLSYEEKEELLHTDDDDILEMDRFKKWLDYEVKYRIEDFLSTIKKYYIEGNQIKIWRKMTVNEKWLNNFLNPNIKGQRVGVYWSYEKNAAEAHWGDFKKMTINLHTIVPEEYVDWSDTILANIDLDIGYDEKEIKLFKNTNIHIYGLEIDDKEIDISMIKNKVFKT